MDTPVNVTTEWYRGGPSNITVDNYTTISPLSITSSSSYVTTLMFNPLGTADSGWYYCNICVQPGAPYIISGVGGGSLSLQVLGQWYQHTPFILTISAPSSSTGLPAPNVTITPSLPPPSLGAVYSLTCQAMVVAGLVLPVGLTWTRADGLYLGTNSTLTLGPLGMADLTSYNCTAVISLPYKGISNVGSSAADVAVRSELWPSPHTPSLHTHTYPFTAPGVVSGPTVMTSSDSTSVISWSPPQLTYGRLIGYTLSIVQLLDYGVPVCGSAVNTSVDVTVMSYPWSRLSEYAYTTPPL